MRPANNAPIYIGLYSQLAELTRNHGYALAVHGSIARDFDLVAIPWSEHPSDPQNVVDDITKQFAFKEGGGDRSIKEHGRIVYTLIVSFGECFLDLSFMPRLPKVCNGGSE